MNDRRVIQPSQYQPGLPLDDLIVRDATGPDPVPLDVLFVGAGPAGLAGAIELAKLCRDEHERDSAFQPPEIGVLEKAGVLGGHSLSGAVVDPAPLRELFPELSDEQFPLRGRVEHEEVRLLTARRGVRIPTPPTMRNRGNSVASLCELVRWLGERAEELGVSIMAGYPAGALLVENDRVVGVRTTPSGLLRDGSPGPSYEPPTDLKARFTVLGEGTRGALAQAYFQWRDIGSPNPQIYALGVKELWQVPAESAEAPRPLDRVLHTVGWPLPRDTFGGSFLYPMGDGLISLGLVVGLDYTNRRLDTHALLQQLKLHPVIRQYLRGGEMVEWGAKTIPEGGFWSLPERFGGDGALIVGDSAGFVDVASLKGVHYAMTSGILAARAIFEALKTGADDPEPAYRQAVLSSAIHSDLRRTRAMRLAFKSGIWIGAVKALLATLTGGAIPGGRIAAGTDAAHARGSGPPADLVPDGRYTFSKVDAVYRADNSTRDDVPVHLRVLEDVPADVAEFYAAMCPAGVFECQGGQLVVNAPNCVDCKATDVLGPRWTPREAATGPNYKRM